MRHQGAFRTPDFQFAQFYFTPICGIARRSRCWCARRDPGESGDAVQRAQFRRQMAVRDGQPGRPDINGQPIENKRRNKGQFIADFKQATRPQYVELSELYFHKREPACVIEINTCNPDPGYPSQNYESDPTGCDGKIIVD